MKQEIWKKIENYQNYEISNFGNVRKILKQTFTRDGYKSIGLVDEFGKSKTFRVHRLVAEAFIENENIDRTMINHKNSIRYDNNIDNLEWYTAKENTKHSIESGNFKANKLQNLTKDEKQKIYDLIQNGERIKEVRAMFNNISISAVHYILENDFGVKDIKLFVSQHRYRHSKDERTRLKQTIMESTLCNQDLAKEINLSKALISKIRRGLEWSDIEVIVEKEQTFKYCPTTGICDEKLIEIKNEILNSKLSSYELSVKFNVNQKTIRNIKNGKTWKLVPTLN